MEPNARIFVAGSRGLVGSAVVRRLEAAGATRLLTATREQLDLRDQAAVSYWFRANRPEYVFLVAGTIGGIFANSTRPAEFIYDNMLIHATVVHAAHQYRVRKLLYLGSSCIYPKLAPQPMKEEHLLTGPLEPTNQPYALAKIAGIEMVDAYPRQYGSDFRAAMPTNLYGPGDNFDLNNSHVIPALIRKFIEAAQAGRPEVTVWGSGTPKREFLYSDDMADACVFLMSLPDDQYLQLLWPGGTLDESCAKGLAPLVNIGAGEDISIRELAEMVKKIAGYSGEIIFDRSKP